MTRLADVSLTLRAGEIVGIAGVSGNGQSELLDALSGLLEPDAGELQLAAARFTPTSLARPIDRARGWRSRTCPKTATAAAWCCRSRRGSRPCSATTRRPRYGRRGWMLQRRDARRRRAMMERYDVRPRDARIAQRPVLRRQPAEARARARGDARADACCWSGQPTRGVDIGAIEFIHGRLRAMRDAGGAVLVVSSELDEILALADRVLVMNCGRITGELPIDACTESRAGPPDGRCRARRLIAPSAVTA